MPAPAELSDLLKSFNQSHLLDWWDEITETQQQQLQSEISAVDFALLNSVLQKSQDASKTEGGAEVAVPPAEYATAPQSVVQQPKTDADEAAWKAAASVGNALLEAGKVAVITVAGGQGSRLGFEHPKGMFPIGPLSDRTLFQIFAEQIQSRRNQSAAAIPWLIMTSAATHQETVDFFNANKFFGLAEDTVHFFQQGSMAAVDAKTGKLLMSNRHSLCLSPDGHGGLVTALHSSGLLQQLEDDGVEHVFYHQVDNPTVIMCDPALIGLHQQHESQLTTNVVRKVSPMEKMGVLADVNGKLEIIEYSEMTEAQASRTDDAGDFLFWAGNTAIHIFSLAFFKELSGDGCLLEVHLANKKVPHLDAEGEIVEPDAPNAYKFERFIFDALPLAKRSLVVEGNREREFNPVKNAEGNDSPATARAALVRIYTDWLSQAGEELSAGVQVEISPLIANDASELAAKLTSGEADVSDFM